MLRLFRWISHRSLRLIVRKNRTAKCKPKNRTVLWEKRNAYVTRRMTYLPFVSFVCKWLFWFKMRHRKIIFTCLVLCFENEQFIEIVFGNIFRHFSTMKFAFTNQKRKNSQKSTEFSTILQMIVLIVVGIGTLFSVAFHMGVKEDPVRTRNSSQQSGDTALEQSSNSVNSVHMTNREWFREPHFYIVSKILQSIKNGFFSSFFILMGSFTGQCALHVMPAVCKYDPVLPAHVPARYTAPGKGKHRLHSAGGLSHGIRRVCGDETDESDCGQKSKWKMDNQSINQSIDQVDVSSRTLLINQPINRSIRLMSQVGTSLMNQSIGLRIDRFNPSKLKSHLLIRQFIGQLR